jgi:hypothetical protein
MRARAVADEASGTSLAFRSLSLRAARFAPPPVVHDHAEVAMARCETCGNDYDKSFTVTMAGVTHTFDSFECAIYTLAPACEHCGCRIIGHGMEVSGRFFCCAHCAHEEGATTLKDRAQIGGHDPTPARAGQ